MTHLEDFVNKHRDEFDDLEPSPGHISAFEQKLQFAASKQRKRFRFPFAQVGAAAVFIAVSVILIHELCFDRTQYSSNIHIIKSNYDNILESRYKQINLAMANLPESVRQNYELQIKEIKEQTKVLENAFEDSDAPEIQQMLLQHYQKTNRALTRLAINAEIISTNSQK